MSKPFNCLWLLNMTVFVICNVLYMCQCALDEICCASAFSLTLNKSVIAFHAFFSLFERVIGFYPFPTLYQSVVDYALKLSSYAWNLMVSGFFYMNMNDCNAIGKTHMFLHLMKNTWNIFLACLQCVIIYKRAIIHYKCLKS